MPDLGPFWRPVTGPTSCSTPGARPWHAWTGATEATPPSHPRSGVNLARVTTRRHNTVPRSALRPHMRPEGRALRPAATAMPSSRPGCRRGDPAEDSLQIKRLAPHRTRLLDLIDVICNSGAFRDLRRTRLGTCRRWRGKAARLRKREGATMWPGTVPPGLPAARAPRPPVRDRPAGVRAAPVTAQSLIAVRQRNEGIPENVIRAGAGRRP